MIIGAGVIGLCIARRIRQKKPNSKILLLEKEASLAFHSSGRNSGVLHAGFYYTPDSLKAKFTREGNRMLKEFCRENGVKVNECGKVVVTQDESELDTLFELEKRGKKNQVRLQLITEKELEEIEPNARTYKYALHSPDTATIDPVEVVNKLSEQLREQNVTLLLGEGYQRRVSEHVICTSRLSAPFGSSPFDSAQGAGRKRCGQSKQGRLIQANKFINCAGLYADKIAQDFSLSKRYKILPFKGLYLKYTLPDTPIRTNIYPVPNIKNPFLGVHFTLTSHGDIKIGPTAIPAFWRENYSKLNRFNFNEFMEIFYCEAKLFLTNSFGFRKLAAEEIKKYSKKRLVSMASNLVKNIDPRGFNVWSKPGIRAQLMDIKTQTLVQDFVVEAGPDSVHVLNAVSPAFTCSIPFAEWVVDKYI